LTSIYTALASGRTKALEVEMNSGLDDVVAAETVLSDVDGALGQLVIRGLPLDQLVETARFEDAVKLVFDGFFEPRDWAVEIGRARTETYPLLHYTGPEAGLPPTDALRALLARLPDTSEADTAVKLIAGHAVFTAGTLRLRQGLAPIAPDPTLSHAADFLRMTTGLVPTDPQATAPDRLLVTGSDHGHNASLLGPPHTGT